LLHYFTNIASYDQLIANVIAGHSWEGYVIEQIINRLANHVQPFFYRTQNGAEIDLCLLKGNEMVASFEIKLSNNPTSSKGNTEAVQDLKTKYNFIVTPSANDYKANATWQVCSLNTLWGHLELLELLKI
jgi:predicted AAA+ superfamily ATPase